MVQRISKTSINLVFYRFDIGNDVFRKIYGIPQLKGLAKLQGKCFDEQMVHI